MKYQDLFTLKNNFKKKSRLSSAVVVIGALKIVSLIYFMVQK